MKKSRRRARPYTRARRVFESNGLPCGSARARLAHMAGPASVRPSVEQLEPRKLLFALTVTPDMVDPFTGLGTAVARFGYTLPFLFKEIPDPTDPQTESENFDDEPIGVVPNNTIFDESGLRVRYGPAADSAVSIVQRPGTEIEDLSVVLREQASLDLGFAVGEAPFPADPPFRIANQFTVTIEGLSVDPDLGTRVELVRIAPDGSEEIVSTLIGADLIAARIEVAPGVFQYTFDAGPAGASFLRFSSADPDGYPAPDQFFVRDISAVFPGGRFTGFTESRIFAAEARLTGPVGATAEFFDLFGRPMIATLALGAPEGMNVPLVDLADTGIPDFNDGIGRIDFSGTDLRSSFAIAGGVVEFDAEDVPEEARFSQGPWHLIMVESPMGNYGAFQSAGFGYALTPEAPPSVIGLPPGPGSVVIGSPTVRDNTSTGAYIGPMPLPTPADFTRTDQGVFTLEGASIGNVMIHGILHGTSRFEGSIERLAVGFLPGSVQVEGDMRTLIVGSDAGVWVRDDAPDTGVAPQLRWNPTLNELSVGRTLGQVHIAGRSTMSITVLGDINNEDRPPLTNVVDYFENEVIFGVDPDEDDGERLTFLRALDSSADPLGRISGLPPFLLLPEQDAPDFRQAVSFGADFFRNDTLLSAEWIGGLTTMARVHGVLGLQDPISTGEDPSDVFAFAASSNQRVVISSEILGGSNNPARFQTRIVDRDGRVVATHQRIGRLTDQNLFGGSQFSFTPEYTGVYYLVVETPPDGSFDTALFYRVTVSGMAPTTFGLLRTGANLGGFGNRLSTVPTINLDSGNMGEVRAGTGLVNREGQEIDPSVVMNLTGVDSVDGDTRHILRLRAVNITIDGSLYALTAGADIGAAQASVMDLHVGRDLGVLVAGLSELAGAPDPLVGDLSRADITIGGQLGLVDVKGGIGIDQADEEDGVVGRTGPVSLRTGTGGGPGHVGSILVGAWIDGSVFTLRTSAGSTVNSFIVGPGEGTQFPGEIRDLNPDIMLGAGSDMRFVDFNLIQGPGDPNAFQEFDADNPLILTDDAGASVRLSITGGAAFPDTSSGLVRLLPIKGSQGAAIARIEVTLIAGANLVITGLTPGTVSIGHILITTDGDTPIGGSSVIINGDTEIDVWKITHAEGPVLESIQNLTPGGDIIAIDVQGLDSLFIRSGNLGRTQTQGIGPKLLGEFLGIQSGYNAEVGGAIGIDPDSIDPPEFIEDGEWNGEVFRAVNSTGFGLPAVLEDIGGPMQPFLNGLIVRGGDVQEIAVGGAVGDVILQGGDLLSLIANEDGLTPLGEFHGIVGSVYARNIVFIDVGDGLAARGPSSLAAAGIFADNHIADVFGGRGLNPRIQGIIIAANRDGPDGDLLGIGTVRIDGGVYDGAQIYAGALDDFWISARVNNFFWALGNVNNVLSTNADLRRSDIAGVDIIRVDIGGVFDASEVRAISDIELVLANEFRNSTVLGEPLEFRRNLIQATGNLTTLRVRNPAQGNITDLTIELQGSVIDRIEGNNITRLNLAVVGTVERLIATNDIRAGRINAGRVIEARAGGDIRATTFRISGPIERLIAQNITTSEIISDGPDGRIDLIEVRHLLSGRIESQNGIDRIVSTLGDINASIRTISKTTGHMNRLEAARDLLVSLDVQGNANIIRAGRHIGAINQEPGSRLLNIGGHLNTIEAPNGQIYTDLRVGQTINLIRTGRVANLPGNDLASRATFLAFGRINQLDLHGDVAGSIVSESGGIGQVRITNGSFRPGNQIVARDGGIDSVILDGGHLMGDIIADRHIGEVRIVAAANGFWGDVGVNPNLSRFIFFDEFRNQLPPDAELLPVFQGPRIHAGTTLGSFIVERGSMWESGISAGHAIGRVFIDGVVMNDPITPGLGGSFIVAGDFIDSIEIGHFVGGLIIAAGITDLGADGRPGGTGVNADTVKHGRIGSVLFRGPVAATTISSGIVPGASGVYNEADSRLAPGFSRIESVVVEGAILDDLFGVRAFAGNGVGFATPGVEVGGAGLGSAAPDRILEFVPAGAPLPKGEQVPFTTNAGETGWIMFTGPGEVFWDQQSGLLAIINSDMSSSLIVHSDQLTLTNVRILSNHGASLGSADVRANLLGDSAFHVDTFVGSVRLGSVDSSGVFGAGNDIGSFILGSLTRGTVLATYINFLGFGGNVGNPSVASQAAVSTLGAGSVLVVGSQFSSVLNFDRFAGSVRIQGEMDRGRVRAGDSIESFESGRMDRARLSAGNRLGGVIVHGSADRSVIYAGGDLGADGAFGGTGPNAVRVSNGQIGSVLINGNFTRSDVAAGAARGPSGFLGTSDDIIAAGRSTIGPVRITGNVVGSNLGSESFRVLSNGTIGEVRVGGSVFESRGNFKVDSTNPAATPLQVSELRVQFEDRIYTAMIRFNQPINEATLSPALTVSEVRDSGNVKIQLAEGEDYSVSYNPVTNTAMVVFSREVTERPLPQRAGIPGPGVYRFELDAAVLRGQTLGTRLDGDADGVLEGDDDDFSQDAFVGDVGDKLEASQVTADGRTVNFYPAGDLDLVMDNNRNPTGLPDVNSPMRITGRIGNHPNHDLSVFRSGGDVDLYKITLRAGQILRLGAMEGPALFAMRFILDSDGNALMGTNVLPFGGVGQDGPLQRMPVSIPEVDQLTFDEHILVQETGTYFIAVGADLDLADVTDPDFVLNIPPVANAIGRYSFTVEVFDDGATGFSADTSSGNGVRVVDAPLPQAFAGPDGVLGTADDRAQVTIGNFRFRLDPGPDGVFGTADDVVIGDNGMGITSVRTAGPDGVFGTVNDRVESFISGTIGRPDPVGTPREISPDIDVYHLNNRQPIEAGTRIRATLKIAENGGNLGLPPLSPELARTGILDAFFDFRGDVQFAVFDTTDSTNIGDARLVASSSQVLPVGALDPSLTDDGTTRYGYDANGDFFIEFVTPGRLGVAGAAPATYALYLQGVVRSDYEIHVVKQGTGQVTPRYQNVFLETKGGVIDWLEAIGETELAAFTTSVVGFSGFIGAQRVDDYVLSNLVTNLNEIFEAANYDVRISTNVTAFEGDDFSTVFLTGSTEPGAFFDNGRFGESQNTDPFNTNRNDEAVVFIPSLAVLGNPPSRAGVDSFVDSLTAAVARRIGELAGLRTLATDFSTPAKVMASNSVFTPPGAQGFRFSSVNTPLSGRFDVLTDTAFYLGQQNDVNLLDRILAPRF